MSAKRLDLRDRLNRIPGVEIAAEALKRRPTIPLAAFTDPVTPVCEPNGRIVRLEDVQGLEKL